MARRGTVMAVVPTEPDAEDLADDLALFTKSFLIPAWETLPFEHISPNLQTMARRAEGLRLLKEAPPAVVVVASARAAMQRLSPSSPDPVVVEKGEEVRLSDLVEKLSVLGYERTDRVEARGEFAVRGGILDVFPAQGEEAIRIDFFGDTVEDVRQFQVGTQRSHEQVERLLAYPAREFRPDERTRTRARDLVRTMPAAASTWERLAEGQIFSGMESWMPWVAEPFSLVDAAAQARVVLVDPQRSRERALDLAREEEDLAGALSPTWGMDGSDHPALYLPLEGDFLEMPSLPASPGDPLLNVRGLEATPGNPQSVAKAIGALMREGIEVVIAMDGEQAADRVARVLTEEGVSPQVIPTGIHRGFVAPALGVSVLGEREIAGRRRAHRSAAHRRVSPGVNYADLTAGDFVVHQRHGIGRFDGLTSRTMAGIERDYLMIGYAGEDRLYVPIDQLASVRKYTGGEAPRISRMGGKDWSETKDRVRRAVAAVAEQVVRLHRARARARGYAFPTDTPWQREMEALFPYEETPDQLVTIDEVKADMQGGQPMDRLVFGDVGYGKTEIAIRAAFKAVQAGKQVAVLCPTTLLAQQHHQTFSDRFEPYPVRVEVLSRFLTNRQQQKVVAGIASGEVDVVIATHRVLSDDVRWKNLGLVVIDEEQRFGVAAKDQLRALKVGVDVLTLTATPIPRTLEMALTGIRDVSHIRTAPEDRHPILTFVGPYDAQTVAAALRRELLRDGQVFYVHNRVRTIEEAAERLRSLVPDARYVVAHGQMSEGQLEQIMLDFWNREFDVMVATTIIESGLDLPQVNTLIVERADLLGLAQLYQLRGRVGRSSQRAYAYLFHPADQVLTEEAHRRLEAIGEATDLGSGFHLALKDLEIRGAGSILGEVQSGHIAAVGFDLYAELVAEAVSKLEGQVPPETDIKEVRIELPVDAHLPDEYLPDQSLRLEAYRRLAAAESLEAVEEAKSEWIDRFGPLPLEAQALIEIARLRVEALRVGLSEIVNLRKEVRLAPVGLSASQEVRLERLAPKAVLRDGVLFVPLPRPDPVAGMIDFLRQMWPGEGPPLTAPGLERAAN
ncbi:MAG TPA: transcription-repair coupling factor [Acidimicrobiia bacterium]|nr:transcription-repair coupling factor [Acidimicrobiia bacterium]